MKTFNRIITVLCTFMLIFSTVVVFADSDDPVVSLSYLNEVFAPAIKEEIKNMFLSGTSEEKKPSPSAPEAFGIVTVKKGQSFIGEQGCEFIVRSGKALAIISDKGGLCDVTEGIDIGAKTIIPKNHHIIIPRSDWRGFLANEEVIVMVKGKYSLN